MKIYCVYDSKVESFGTPFFFKTKGEALRGFTEIANDGKTQIGRYPADFTLFEVGDYDERSCKFDLYNTPISVVIAIELVNKAEALSPLSANEKLAVMQ